MPVNTVPGLKPGGQIKATGIDSSAKPSSRRPRNNEYSQIVCFDAIRATRSDCFADFCDTGFFCSPFVMPNIVSQKRLAGHCKKTPLTWDWKFFNSRRQSY